MKQPPKIPFEKEKEILQTADEFRTEARKHWEYTRKILESSMRNYAGVYGLELVGTLAMCETIYIEAMIHGYKHALEKLSVDETSEAKPDA
jgi:hypothetical protein